MCSAVGPGGCNYVLDSDLQRPWCYLELFVRRTHKMVIFIHGKGDSQKILRRDQRIGGASGEQWREESLVEESDQQCHMLQRPQIRDE